LDYKGTQDPGELGIEGVTITLDGATTTVTDALGFYSFDVTSEGVHIVVETDLPGYLSTTPNEVHVDVISGNDYERVGGSSGWTCINCTSAWHRL
jgi:hypothetical protein